MPATNVLTFDRAFRAVGARRRFYRPTPPQSLQPRAFEASPTAATWIRETFILPEAPLFNPDHAHLAFAKLGVVWTGVLNNRHQRTIIATCETTKQNTSGAWKKARAEQQLEDWFGELPDFLITLYAPALTTFDDRSFLRGDRARVLSRCPSEGRIRPAKVQPRNRQADVRAPRSRRRGVLRSRSALRTAEGSEIARRTGATATTTSRPSDRRRVRDLPREVRMSEPRTHWAPLVIAFLGVAFIWTLIYLNSR